MVSSALFLADFVGAATLPFAPYVAALFAVLAGAGLIMSLSQSEATELQRSIEALLDELESPAAAKGVPIDLG